MKLKVIVEVIAKKLMKSIFDRRGSTNFSTLPPWHAAALGGAGRSRVFSCIFPVEMESFMFLSLYRDTKAIFYLFYKITMVFPSFRDVIHVLVLLYKMKMTSALSLYSERK